jgi:hypothetical protein
MFFFVYFRCKNSHKDGRFIAYCISSWINIRSNGILFLFFSTLFLGTSYKNIKLHGINNNENFLFTWLRWATRVIFSWNIKQKEKIVVFHSTEQAMARVCLEKY